MKYVYKIYQESFLCISANGTYYTLEAKLNNYRKGKKSSIFSGVFSCKEIPETKQKVNFGIVFSHVL